MFETVYYNVVCGMPITNHTFYMAPAHCPPSPSGRRGRKREGTYGCEGTRRRKGVAILFSLPVIIHHSDGAKERDLGALLKRWM